MHIPRTARRLAVALATAIVLAVPTTVPAQAAGTDAGLYGGADPTYDGVYRQSLALLGLAANGITPPASAIAWLLGQQCADGSFQAYRADTSLPCAKPDPVNYTGPDTNQTGAALMALMALDNDSFRLPPATTNRIVRAADKAGLWLIRAQNSDGGWPYYPGGTSDANSTGVALAGILTQARSTGIPAYRAASRFLGRLSGSCADGGGFAYQPGSKPDALATSQGLIGLVGPLPITGPRRLAVAVPCANTARAKAVSYLATALRPSGVLPSAFGSGPDYSTTATATLGLVGAGQGRAAVTRAAQALQANAAGYVGTGAAANPGNAGLLLLVADAVGVKPTSFGGVNLVATLSSTLRK
jgi:hypothetical protein